METQQCPLGSQGMHKWATLLALLFAAHAAGAQSCVDPVEILSSSAREERQVAAQATFQKESRLVETRHCAINTFVQDPESPGEFVAWVVSQFVYQPDVGSSSAFSLDVVECVGAPTQPVCELRTEAHYFQGDLSFSIRLLDGIGVVATAARIVEATLNRPCGPVLPAPGDTIQYLDRLHSGPKRRRRRVLDRNARLWHGRQGLRRRRRDRRNAIPGGMKVSVLPPNNGMELTVKSDTPFARRRAKVAQLFPAAHPWR